MSENKRLPGICRSEHRHLSMYLSMYNTWRGGRSYRVSMLKWLSMLSGVETKLTREIRHRTDLIIRVSRKVQRLFIEATVIVR